jgi:hypothetical protein
VSLTTGDGLLELAYEAEQPPSEIALSLADAIARVHGGELIVSQDGASVTLTVRLADALPVAA